MDKFGETSMEGNTLTTFNLNNGSLKTSEAHSHLVPQIPPASWWNTSHKHYWHSFWVSWDEKWIRKASTDLWHKSTKQNYQKEELWKILLTLAIRNKEPWQVVYINCTGPWDILYKSDITDKTITYKLNLLTITDACSGWTEFVFIKNKSAQHTAHLFDVNCRCQYPQPQKFVYNNGSKFIGFQFQDMLES